MNAILGLGAEAMLCKVQATRTFEYCARTAAPIQARLVSLHPGRVGGRHARFGGSPELTGQDVVGHQKHETDIMSLDKSCRPRPCIDQHVASIAYAILIIFASS